MENHVAESYARNYPPPPPSPSEIEASVVATAAPGTFTVGAPHRHRPVTLEETLWSSNPDVNSSARLFTDALGDPDMAVNGDPPLYKTLGGRVMTQAVARGLFGAAMFAAGSYMIHKWQPGTAMQDQHWMGKPLEALSLLFDTPEKLLKGGQAAHSFNQFVHYNGGAIGMTMGQEMVARTWAFASGSIGAALGRNFVALFDPNYKKSWRKNGEIDWGELAKATAKETWRIMSYNQGEDWFAAVPYIWQLRAARAPMTKGFGFDAPPDALIWDLQNDGSGTIRTVGADGKLGHSYEGIGALDFQSRFMAYNFYTLVFRDLYNHIGHSFGKMREEGFKLEMPDNPAEAAGHFVTESAKYLAKSYLKSQLYMAPATLMFWPQNMAMATLDPRMADAQTGQVLTTQPVTGDNHAVSAAMAARVSDIGQRRIYNGSTEVTNLDAASLSQPGSPIGRALQPLGRLEKNYANTIEKFIRKTSLADKDAQVLANAFTRGQFAYLPYMFSKYEFAQLFDTPQMDAALYRLIDGITSGNAKEMKAAIGDIWAAMMQRPPSPEIYEDMHEGQRGLINSRHEAELKTTASQERLWEEEATRALAMELEGTTPKSKATLAANKAALERVYCAPDGNNPADCLPLDRPETTVAQAAHQGAAAQLVAVQAV